MKKIYLLAVMLLCSIMAFSQVKKVAILEIVDKEGKISYSQKLMLRSSLAKAVTNTPGYEAYDRTDMDAIMGEQDFQRTGMVSDDQIKRLGEMTGASYILVAEAVKTDESSLFVTAKILDVETARTEQTDYVTMGIGTKTILQGCEELAGKLLHVEQSAEAPTKAVSTTKESRSRKVVAPAAITRRGGDYYHNGAYMSKQEYKNFLQNTCPEAFALYKQGDKLVKWGWSLFAIGGALTVTGAVFASVGQSDKGYWVQDGYYDYVYDYYTNEYIEQYVETSYYVDSWEYSGLGITGIAMACAGSAMFASSIPMFSVGYVKRNKSMKVYNTNCEKSEVAFNLTAGQNGLGLAINF